MKSVHKQLGWTVNIPVKRVDRRKIVFRLVKHEHVTKIHTGREIHTQYKRIVIKKKYRNKTFIFLLL